MKPPAIAPSLAGSRVLVTGASGFVGQALCRRLAAAGAAVVGVSRRARAAGAGVSSWHTADLGEPEAAAALVRRSAPDAVFHLASFVSGSRDLAAVLPAFRANLASTAGVLAGACEAGVRRVVLAGSMEEPAPGPAGPSGGEPPWPVPGSPYAAAKLAASTYGRFFHALYGTPVVVARLFMVYGPGQADTTKLVPHVILSLLAGESPRLSSGDRAIDWLYVEDAAAGLAALAAAPGIAGETLDLGSGRLATVREVAERLRDLAGGTPPITYGALPDRPLEVSTVARAERTEARTGWRPAVALEEGLARTFAAIRDSLAGRAAAARRGPGAPAPLAGPPAAPRGR